MSSTGKALRRAMLWSVLGILAAGVVAPFINAARFQKQIHDGLERGLQRKVEIAGKIHFTLFAGPGFVVDDVLIAEDPRMGIEPFAHVSSLSARIRLRSLWTGKLEFSNLRLDEPSVNLVKAADGPWNIQPFLEKAVAPASPRDTAPLPDIQVRSGRLNVKFGDTKSVFYLANADVDITALSDAADAFSVRFEGEPARTDRAAQNFGRFSGRGKWTPAQDRESSIEMSVRLEKSSMAELLTLLAGHDSGVHGLITAQARFAGPLSGIQVSCQAQIEDIHRWDLSPPKGEGWPIAIRGKLNLREETLELETLPERDRPVDARLRLRRMLTKPEYGILVTARSVPLAPMLAIARHMGAGIAQQLELTGSASGAFGYSSSEGFQGAFTATAAAAKTTASDAVRCERADLIVEHDRWLLAPTQVAIGHGQGAMLQAEYVGKSNSLDVQLTTRGLTIGEMQSGTGRLMGAAAVPVLEQLEGGRWHGSLRYQLEGGAAGKWSGSGDLESTKVEVPGLAQKVLVHRAKIAIDGNNVVVSRLAGEIGKTRFEGEYHYQQGAARPHRAMIVVDSVSLSELERILKPSLARRQGFLARTLRFQAPTPDWIKTRHAEIRAQIGTLAAGEVVLEGVRGRILWDATKVEMTDLTAQIEGGAMKASLSVDLGKNLPFYQIKGNAEKVGWQDGELDADARIRASGTDSDFLASLRAEGCFSARSVSLAADAEFNTIAGCYDFTAGNPMRLVVSKLQGAIGAESYAGKGAIQPGGRLQLDFSGAKPFRLTGTLTPWKMEVSR